MFILSIIYNEECRYNKMTNYYIGVANDDWYVAGVTRFDGTATIFVSNNQTVSPPLLSRGFGDIDTSAIPDEDVITAARLRLDESSYSASKRVSKTYAIQIWNGSAWQSLTNGSHTYSGSAGVLTQLTAGELAYISKTAKTSFRVVVGNPGTGKFRLFYYNAYETSQATALRLDVTHAAPAAAGQVITICS